MKIIKAILVAGFTAYLLFAFCIFFAVTLFGAKLLTAIAVGLQWPRIFWRW